MKTKILYSVFILLSLVLTIGLYPIVSFVLFILAMSLSFIYILLDLIKSNQNISDSNIFISSREMALSDKRIHKALAFLSLLKLKNKKNFQKEIDFIFKNTNFEKIKLDNANLENSYLHSINLQYSTLILANIKNANLENANLEGVIFIGAHLEEANLENANLQKANFLNAYLWGTNLENANLTNANLENAYLLGANLTKAKLENTRMKNCYLKGAKLSKRNLDYAKEHGALMDGVIVIKEEIEDFIIPIDENKTP